MGSGQRTCCDQGRERDGFRVENVCVGLAFLPCFLVSGISAGTFGWSEMYNPFCDVKNGKIAADQVYFFR